MTTSQRKHIDMDRVALRMIAAGKAGDIVPAHVIMTQAQYLASVTERLRELRLELNDAAFRRRYWKYLG